MINTNTQGEYSSQRIDNLGFDKEFQVPASEGLGYDGQTLQRKNADNMQLKVVTSGSYTYICKSKPGTAEATAKWQCKRVDTSVSGTTKILYAGGSPDFNQTASDPTALSYS